MKLKIVYLLISLAFISLIMCQSNVANEAALARTQWVQDSIKKQVYAAEEAKKKETIWVDAQLANMSVSQKLGQLFMLGAYPDKGASDFRKVQLAIDSHHIGGLIFFRGQAATIARLTNQYQALANCPLMMAMDAEWGTNMRVNTAVKFPRQLMMGALQNNAYIYEFGAAVAAECKAMGIHINFAPVVDVNNNPANPVIGDRSFGESRENVTAKSFQYIKGLQDQGIMACAKHFPGHGDTDVDSHKDLPVIPHGTSRLDSIELYPFKNLIQHGVQSIMVAHLQIPALDSTPHLPVTLSKPVVTDLLQQKLGFEGLIFTDALNMRGVTKHFKDGETDVKALLAGNDVLLVTQDIPKAKQKILKAIDDKRISWKEIERRIRKILAAKYQMGLNQYRPVSVDSVQQHLNVKVHQRLKETIVSKALTLIDQDAVLPLANKKVAFVSLGTSNNSSPFDTELKRYGIGQHFHGLNRLSQSRIQQLVKYDVVVVALHQLNRSHRSNFGVNATVQRFVQQLSQQTKVLLVAFGSPYALRMFPDVQAAVVAYNHETLTQKLTAKAIAGALPFRGRLPVNASAKFKYAMGKDTEVQKMMYASNPEEVGLDAKVLSKIESIATEMMRSKASPGCQVLVAKDGKIAYHRSFGYYTYARKQKVELDNIYDLASVTKVAATTLTVMKLVDDGLIDINQPLSFYLPQLRGTNKSRMTIKEIMVHKAGLKPWIPFYVNTLDKQKKPIMGRYYATQKDAIYSIRIAENLYFDASKLDSVLFQPIYNQELRRKKNYKYSDLGFYLLANLVETVTGKDLDTYTQEHFYRPMGLHTMMFNPLAKGVEKETIIPTEMDNYFRYQKIQGDVHDMGAGMMRGVSGHAGLFSNAQDLSAIYQMLINGGEYGGKRYLKAATVQQFTALFSQDSRRGIGFDRKEVSTSPNTSINVAYQASEATFGHQGFTGIGAWGDPQHKIVYLFLSNRTFPSGENMTLIRKDIRSRIQEVVYEAIIPKDSEINSTN